MDRRETYKNIIYENIIFIKRFNTLTFLEKCVNRKVIEEKRQKPFLKEGGWRKRAIKGRIEGMG